MTQGLDVWEPPPKRRADPWVCGNRWRLSAGSEPTPCGFHNTINPGRCAMCGAARPRGQVAARVLAVLQSADLDVTTIKQVGWGGAGRGVQEHV